MNQRPWILALTAALALAAGCKKDEPAAPAPSSETAKQPGVQPGPADPAQAGSGGDWRARRGRNGDAAMTDEQRAAVNKQRAEMMRKRLDTDGDGKLTPGELAAARGRMRFDDPAAIDTNHDGDISTDELAAAMKARADQRRAQRAGSGNADGTGGGDGSGDGDGSGGW